MSSKNSEKFEDEILKWREGAYAYCMEKGDDTLNAAKVVPQFAKQWLQQKQAQPPHAGAMDAAVLHECRSPCAIWNAMQSYLKGKRAVAQQRTVNFVQSRSGSTSIRLSFRPSFSPASRSSSVNFFSRLLWLPLLLFECDSRSAY